MSRCGDRWTLRGGGWSPRRARGDYSILFLGLVTQMHTQSLRAKCLPYSTVQRTVLCNAGAYQLRTLDRRRLGAVLSSATGHLAAPHNPPVRRCCLAPGS